MGVSPFVVDEVEVVFLRDLMCLAVSFFPIRPVTRARGDVVGIVAPPYSAPCVAASNVGKDCGVGVVNHVFQDVLVGAASYRFVLFVREWFLSREVLSAGSVAGGDFEGRCTPYPLRFLEVPFRCFSTRDARVTDVCVDMICIFRLVAVLRCVWYLGVRGSYDVFGPL